MNQKYLWVLVLSTAMISPVTAQQTVTPANGQSPEQQQKDETECYQFAVAKTGFDPSAAPQAAAAPPTTATGTTAGAGVRGAARGAVAAEVVGGDAGKGAVAGAAVNRSRSRRGNRAAEEQAAQQQTAINQAEAAYYQTNAECLVGRGYTVQ